MVYSSYLKDALLPVTPIGRRAFGRLHSAGLLIFSPLVVHMSETSLEGYGANSVPLLLVRLQYEGGERPVDEEEGESDVHYLG